MNRRANKPPSRKPLRSIVETLDEQEVQSIPPVPSTFERHEMWQGPVPPPDLLEKFDILVPGTARIMLEQAVQESQYRRKLEESTTLANIETQRRLLDLDVQRSTAVARSDLFGQAAGVCVSVGCIVGAIYLALNGQKEIAGALTILPSAAVLQAFFAKRGSSMMTKEDVPPKK